MGFSRITFPGDGVTDTFNVVFALGFISEDDVRAYVEGELDGNGDIVYRPIDFLSPTTMRIGGDIPSTAGRVITFDRTVEKEALLVNYVDGDIMNDENLNTSQKQMLMAVQELIDGRFNTFVQDVDLGGKRIENLGEPVNPQDAVTKQYVDGLISTGLVNAIRAENAANQAEIFRNFAHLWAVAPVGTLINDGFNPENFSAYHWSQLASEVSIPDGSITLDKVSPEILDRANHTGGFPPSAFPTQSEAEEQDLSEANTVKSMNVLRTLQAINESIRQKGHVVPDLFTGLANDRERLQAALDSDEGSSVFLNRPFVMTPGDDAQVLLWRRPKRVFGNGMFRDGSQLQFSSAIPSDMDWVRLRPDMTLGDGESRYGWSWEKTFLRRESGSTPGRRGFFIDLETDEAASFLAKFRFTENWVWEPGSEAFFSNKDGTTGSGVFNGFFTSYIAHNWFVSGPGAGAVMRLWNSGDSLFVYDNIMQGYGIGIHTSPVTGAAMQVFQANNITARGGSLYVEGGQQVKFLYNQCELVVPMETGQSPLLDSMILLNGSNCEIIGNNLGAKEYGHCIRITSGSNNLIDGVNTMSCDTAGGKHHVVYTGPDVGLHNTVAASNRFLNLTGSPSRSISDGATNAQIGSWRKLTLSNGWTDHSDVNYYQGLYFMVDENHRVCLRGQIVGGTNTAGTTIATLPAGARPERVQRFKVVLSGGIGQLIILPSGQIQVSTPLSDVQRVSFDDVTINTY